MRVVRQAFMILSLLTLAKASKSHHDKDAQVIKTYVVPWYCKSYKTSKVKFIHFGASIKKEAVLSYKFRGIGGKIKDALECGRQCLDSGTAGYCTSTGIISKRKRRHSSSYRQVDLQGVLNIDPARIRPSVTPTDQVHRRNDEKKCNEKEMACYVLTRLWKSPESAPAKYTESSPYSQPQCKVYKKRLTWIMHKDKWCKVVQPKKEAWIETAWCDYKSCCANKYKIWPLTECRPSGWTKVTFCVYCPGKKIHEEEHYRSVDISKSGVMDIVTRYLPQSCSCANNMCAYPAEKNGATNHEHFNKEHNHKGPVKEGFDGHEPYKAGSDIPQPVKEGSNVHKPVKEGPYIQEPVKAGSKANKPVKEGPYMQKPVKEGLKTNKPVNKPVKGPYTKKPVKEGSKVNKPVRGPYTKQPFKAGSEANKAVKEGPYMQKPVKEGFKANKPVNKPVKVPYTKKPVKEGSKVNKPVKEGPYMQKPVKEGSKVNEPVNKPVKEGPYIQKPVKEGYKVNKPVKEGSSLYEPVQEGYHIDGPSKEQPYIYEPAAVKEGSNVHESNKGGSYINEPVKEGSHTHEPVKEESSNSGLPGSTYRGRYWYIYRLLKHKSIKTKKTQYQSR